MTLHLGDVPSGTTLYIPFASYNAAGASVTLTGLAVTDIEIYKNGSVTQRSSDAGFALLDTDGIDFDSITGIHGFSVNLADNTDSGFYSVGGFYWVVVSAVTIDAQTVNFIAATFRIVGAEHTAGYPVATIKVGTGTGEIDLSSGGVPVASIAANAITATSINADAITAAKIADGAIDAATFAAGAINAAAIAADAIGASELAADAATEIGTAVWATTTRLLTAGTNIVLAKGTGVTGFNDLSAAQVNAEADTALADYDPPTKADLDAADDAVLSAIAALSIPTANQNADALLDRSAGVETGLTPRQWFRLAGSALFGKSSGLDTTTAIFRDVGDTKDRIEATVDTNGNRSAVTLDAS